MSTLALFPDTRDGAGDRDCWATPLEAFESFDAAFGPFTLDACALSWSAKCARYYSPADDGLTQPWHEHAGRGAVWCNPPFSDPGRWCHKAWRESLRGARVAVLLPGNRTDQEWWHRTVVPYAAVHFIRHRIAYRAPPGVPWSSPSFASVLALYGYHGGSEGDPQGER